MLWIYCKRDPSVESFRAANALFYWWKSGVEREKKKSMILGATLQKCQKEVQTKKWLFLSYCQWLNMNSPFPSDPALADDMLVHDFHFIISHRHEDIKSTLCSILRWNHIVRDQGVRLQIFHTTGCVLCLPRSVPFPTSLSPESHWTVPRLLPEQRNSLIWCLLTIPSSVSMERTIISWCCLLFQVMQRSINSISAIFLSCFNILQIETCLQVTYRIVSTLLGHSRR